jgi:hypothetical protein
MDALIHLINYLWYTKNRGLFLKDTDKNQQDFRIKLIAFADAAGSNEQDSKSQYAVTYNLIPYRDGDTIQNEEEMNSEATKDVIYFRNLLEELHQTQWSATPVYNDNQPAILLSSKLTGKRTRVRYCLRIYIHEYRQITCGCSNKNI